MQGADFLDEDLDDRPDDDEFANDEISQLNLSAHVGQCLKKAYADDPQRLTHLTSWLKDDERQVLKDAVL